MVSGRGRRRFALMLVAMFPAMAWMVAGTAVANAVVTTWTIASFGPVPVKNSHGYTFTYHVEKYVGGKAVWDSLERTLPTGNHPHQSVTYNFSGGTFTCTSTLGRCKINTGTVEGKYGKNVQTFHGTPSTRTFRCRNGSKADVVTTSKGHARGTLTLNTYNHFFGGTKGTLTNAGAGKLPDKIPGTVTKDVHYRDCRHPFSCSTGFSLHLDADHSGGNYYWSFMASRPLSTGKAFFKFYFEERDAPISHEMWVKVPLSNFTVNDAVTSAEVNGDAGATFFTGYTAFSGPAPTTTGTTHCKSQDSDPGTVKGTMAFHFDGLKQMVLGDQTGVWLDKTYKV